MSRGPERDFDNSLKYVNSSTNTLTQMYITKVSSLTNNFFIKEPQ